MNKIDENIKMNNMIIDQAPTRDTTMIEEFQPKVESVSSQK